jgi:DNA-binding response OmpR family regulator
MYEWVRFKPERWPRGGAGSDHIVHAVETAVGRERLQLARQLLAPTNVLPRVLLVEDEADHTRVMAIGLRVEGFEVETASNADGALRLLAAVPFDLAIVDLMMPRTNGLQLARMVRERHPGMCVVLTSAYHLSEPQLSRADCGAVGFVAKPCDLTELARYLRAKLSAKLSCRTSTSTLGGAAA